MKKKDCQLNSEIEALFDDYAASLPPQTELVSQARAKLAAENVSQCDFSQGAVSDTVTSPVSAAPESKNSKPRRKRLGWIYALAACVTVLLVMSAILPFALNSSNSDGSIIDHHRFAPSSVESFEVYSDASVYRTRIDSASESPVELPISALSQEYKVTYQKYYGFYFEGSDKLAYVEGYIGVETDYGVVEVSFVAESKGYVQEQRQKTYEKFIQNQNTPYLNGGAVENGEYLTESYFASNGYNFYINAQSNVSNQYEAQKIIEYFW